jgi:hypothetical protein
MATSFNVWTSVHAQLVGAAPCRSFTIPRLSIERVMRSWFFPRVAGERSAQICIQLCGRTKNIAAERVWREHGGENISARYSRSLQCEGVFIGLSASTASKNEEK